MDAETPIACSLSGTDLQERYRDLAEFGSTSLIERTADAEGRRLRFRRTAGTAERLRSIIAAEQECCPFLTFELTETDNALELHIGAPDDARPVADGLAAAFGL